MAEAAEAPNELAIAQLNRFSEQLLKQAMQNDGNVMISPARSTWRWL
jgi:hypothetical protein